MADFSEWGAEASGARLYELDHRKAVAGLLDAQHMLGEIAMQPTKQAHMQAQSEALNLETQQKRNFLQNLAQRRAMRPEEDQETELVDGLEELARAARDTGEIEQAGKIVNIISQVQGRKATAVASEARALRDSAVAAREQAVRIGAIAGSAKDQTSYDLMLLSARSQGMDVSGFTGSYERDKPVLDQLVSESLSAKDKAELDLKRVDDAEKKRMNDFQMRETLTRRPLQDAQRRLAEARIKRLDKIGAGPAASPSLAEVAQAEALLKEAVPSMDKDTVGRSAFTIAAEAKALLRTNPAISDIDLAIQRVIQKHKDEGNFVTESGMKSEFPYFGDRTTLSPRAQGKIKRAPKQLPRGADGKVDRSKLEVGELYTNDRGYTVEWTKNGAKLIGPGSGAGVAPSDDEDEEDE